MSVPFSSAWSSIFSFSVFNGHQDLWTDPGELANVKSGSLLGLETDFTIHFVQVPGNIASFKVYCSKCCKLSIASIQLSLSALPFAALSALFPQLCLWWTGAPLLLGSQECMGAFIQTSKPLPVRLNFEGEKMFLWVPGFSGSRRASPGTHGRPQSRQ